MDIRMGFDMTALQIRTTLVLTAKGLEKQLLQLLADGNPTMAVQYNPASAELTLIFTPQQQSEKGKG